MIRNIIIAITIILFELFLLYPLARAQDNHAMYHAFYNGWVNQRGASCCNNQDCGRLKETDERTNRGILEVRILGEWCAVQPYHYLKRGNVPDASVSHVCVQKSPLDYTSPCARLLCYQPKPGS